MAVDFTLGRDSLSIAAGLLIIVSMLGLPRRFESWRYLRLLPPLLACSLGYLAWYYVFSTPGEFKHLYREHHLLGRTFVMTAILVFIVANYRIPFPSWLLDTIFIGGGLCINAYAVYEGYMNHFQRVQLDMSSATAAAYVFTAFDIFMLCAILKMKNKWRYYLLPAAFFLSYCSIILTGTRAAMIVYPIILLTLMSIGQGVSRKVFIALALSVLTALTLLAPVLASRFNDTNNDFNKILNNADEGAYTSIGTRLNMAKSGLQSGLAAPLGQSAEQRMLTIKRFAESESEFNGFRIFLNVHLHNELIETFSLRGIGGVAALIWLYAALLLHGTQRNPKNTALTLLCLSMMLYGLTDVIFQSRDIYLVYLISIVFSIAFSDHLTRKKSQMPV